MVTRIVGAATGAVSVLVAVLFDALTLCATRTANDAAQRSVIAATESAKAPEMPR